MAEFQVKTDSQVPSSKGEAKEVMSKEEYTKYIHDRIKEDVAQEMKAEKASMITVFGIFVALIVFTSLEVQILQNSRSPFMLIGVSLVLLASLLIFVIALDHIGRGWRDSFQDQLKRFPWIVSVLALSLFIGGITTVCLDNREYYRNLSEILLNAESDEE